MAKWCFNYDSGEYEYIDRNGFSFSSGEFVFNWDNSEYQNEENDDNSFGKMTIWIGKFCTIYLFVILFSFIKNRCIKMTHRFFQFSFQR